MEKISCCEVGYILLFSSWGIVYILGLLCWGIRLYSGFIGPSKNEKMETPLVNDDDFSDNNSDDNSNDNKTGLP